MRQRPPQQKDHTPPQIKTGPPPVPKELQDGRTILGGRYILGRKIGSGGMAIVYAAYDTQTKGSDGTPSKVAVKVLQKGLIRENRIAKHGFVTEIGATSRIKHPNIVEMIDFGTEIPQNENDPIGGIVLVMEYVKGKDIYQEMQNGKIPIGLERAKNIMINVCKAIEVAHKQGILHRDMKLQNVMLVKGEDDKEEVKVLDFGLAKIRERQERDVKGISQCLQQGTCQETTLFGGTPMHMAPEMTTLGGESKAKPASPTTEVYALGVMYYRMITAVLPIDGDVTEEYWHRKKNTDPLPPSFQRKNGSEEIPLALDRIILRAIKRNNEPLTEKVSGIDEEEVAFKRCGRFATVKQLRLAIEQNTWNPSMDESSEPDISILSGTNIEKVLAPHDKPSMARRVLKTVSAAVVVLAIVTAGIIGWTNRTDIERKARQMVLEYGKIKVVNVTPDGGEIEQPQQVDAGIRQPGKSYPFIVIITKSKPGREFLVFERKHRQNKVFVIKSKSKRIELTLEGEETRELIVVEKYGDRTRSATVNVTGNGGSIAIMFEGPEIRDGHTKRGRRGKAPRRSKNRNMIDREPAKEPESHNEQPPEPRSNTPEPSPNLTIIRVDEPISEPPQE